jgi:hypothetical protein
MVMSEPGTMVVMSVLELLLGFTSPPPDTVAVLFCGDVALVETLTVNVMAG